MAYENLLKSVEESADERERELRKAAQDKAEDIRAEAAQQAAEIQEQAIREAEHSAAMERNRDLYLTKGALREAALKSRERIFNAAVAEAMSRLQQLREDPAYPAIFGRLAREAAGGMGDAPFRVHIDRRDAALCETTLAALGLRCEILTDIECMGGLMVSSPDGRITLSNTIESRLERVQEHRRMEIYSLLFGGP